MEMIVVAMVVLFVLGALFVIPRSKNKGKAKETQTKVATKMIGLFQKMGPLRRAEGLGLVKVTASIILRLTPRKKSRDIIRGMIVGSSSKVYDVTPYVEEHPGGDAILNNAGSDSTEGFYGPQHATRVFDMVDEFYIGELKP